MEITNEIKAKVMMQYWGQDLSIPDYFGYELEGVSGLSVKAFGRNNGMHELFKLEACKLILKPLSSITDEDATELACIHKWKELWEEDSFMDEEAINRSLIEKGNDMVTTELFKLPFKGYQFLQYKGYDLPQYLLGGKTLKEAGLAIYPEDLK